MWISVFQKVKFTLFFLRFGENEGFLSKFYLCFERVNFIESCSLLCKQSTRVLNWKTIESSNFYKPYLSDYSTNRIT